MKSILLRRIFWNFKLVQRVDGYYWEAYNWPYERTELVFAGYFRQAVNDKDTAWSTIKERLKQ